MLKAVYEKYERFLMPLTLIAGLGTDFLTYKNIQVGTQLTLLAVYAVVVGFCIAYIHYYDAPGITDRGDIARTSRLSAQVALQFCFGNLLSSSLVFYWFSGAFAVTWPLVLIIAALMVSNDALRHIFIKPVVQIGLYFFVTFSLLVLALPYLFNSISFWVFIYAGILSLVYMFMYLGVMSRLVEHIRNQRFAIAWVIAVIFGVMNGLYFLKIIPPIPLSLRTVGVYHHVQRTGSAYVVQAEDQSWWRRLLDRPKLHLAPGERVYIYASVFAPADLNAKIVHDWQYYDPNQGTWVSTDKISYAIAGGRVAGYRGYTLKSSIAAGAWRVDVETERGQVLGRVRFTVEKVDAKPELTETSL